MVAAVFPMPSELLERRPQLRLVEGDAAPDRTADEAIDEGLGGGSHPAAQLELLELESPWFDGAWSPAPLLAPVRLDDPFADDEPWDDAFAVPLADAAPALGVVGPAEQRTLHRRVGTDVAVRRQVRRRAQVRRRRLVVGAVLVAVGLALALPVSALGGHQVAGAGTPLSAGATYVVQPGDTLWGIAQRLDAGTGGDPRVLVAQMADQLGSDTVIPGEHLVLP